MQKEEEQKAARIKEKLKSMERDLTLKDPLGEAKEKLWSNIVDSIHDIWPPI